MLEWRYHKNRIRSTTNVAKALKVAKSFKVLSIHYLYRTFRRYILKTNLKTNLFFKQGIMPNDCGFLKFQANDSESELYTKPQLAVYLNE